MPTPNPTREALPADLPAIAELGARLPEWFNAEGIVQLGIDIAHTRCALAEDADGNATGFISWYTYLGVGHIAWMGVAPDQHRRGTGRSLLRFCEDALRSTGAKELRVETLGEAVEYEPYARTRAFYYAVGFTEFERETSDNPAWGEKLILSKQLSS